MSSAIANLQAARERAAVLRPKVHGFPYLAEVLRQAGVNRYHHSIPAATTLYLTDAGPIVEQHDPIVAGLTDVAAWNRDALVDAIRTDQAGQSSYPQFVHACWAAGVVHYDVDLHARTCTYSGAAGERHVESYPRVDVAAGQRYPV
ncbi:DUF1398 family protein [Mycobacterium sp. ML4]